MPYGACRAICTKSGNMVLTGCFSPAAAHRKAMEISPAQCRGSRGLLDWTQADLAKKVGVALRTIRDFESGKRKPLQIVRSSIKQALEEAGIEFLGEDGLRLKT
jgi:DNA-binding XRE family transcriptional regulator